MNRTIALLGALVLVPASSARGADAEKIAMARVRLTTDAAQVTGCARIGAVRDESIKDLRRKIVRAGGNTAVLSFRADDLETVHAEVFRCPAAPRAPAGVPPPPPGRPPPPPPPYR